MGKAQGKLPRRHRLTHGSPVSAPQQIGSGRLLPPHASEAGCSEDITATAHKLARIIFHLVTTRQEFDDGHFVADQLRFQKRQEAKFRAKARALGFQLIVLEQAA
jgi:hypothetical protein